MNNSEVLQKLRAYLKCRKRQVKGIYYACNNKKCDDCDLCYMQGTTDEHIEAIEVATQALEKLKDNEPCCGCDSRKENREVKIVTVSDLIKILDTKENRYGATGKPRMLNLSLNGIFAGSVKAVKLDGYGDGLITDVTMEITSSKFTTTNADKIRNMSDEELAEFIITFKNTFGEEYEGEASCMEWLQSEAE